MRPLSELEHLRSLSFESTLAMWPYRTLGRPDSEREALTFSHKLRLTFPGLSAQERQTSLEFLQATGKYPWVQRFWNEDGIAVGPTHIHEKAFDEKKGLKRGRLPRSQSIIAATKRRKPHGRK